jgi:uncharacterized protein
MLIKVKVFPESKEEGINKKSEDSFEIRVKEKPKMGQANEAVITLLSYYFEIPRGKVRLIKGARERSKIFEIKE